MFEAQRKVLLKHSMDGFSILIVKEIARPTSHPAANYGRKSQTNRMLGFLDKLTDAPPLTTAICGYVEDACSTDCGRSGVLQVADFEDHAHVVLQRNTFV